MIFASHLVFGCYGFWLPNDPRGSWSTYVGSRKLFAIGGKATTVSTRRSLAHNRHDPAVRQEAKRALKDPPVRFNGRQALEVARGFDMALHEADYTCHACAVMPDHVHLVIARHERAPRAIIGHLKARATRCLNDAGLNPKPKRKPWCKAGWCVYLDNATAVGRAIRYVEKNPEEGGLPRQRWNFVVPS